MGFFLWDFVVILLYLMDFNGLCSTLWMDGYGWHGDGDFWRFSGTLGDFGRMGMMDDGW